MMTFHFSGPYRVTNVYYVEGRILGLSPERVHPQQLSKGVSKAAGTFSIGSRQ